MNNQFKSSVPLFLARLGDSLALALRFFSFQRNPFTAEHDFTEPFFIIGSGRSGNTLLRSMLVAGNEVSIPPESYVFPRIIRIYATYNFLPWEKLCSLIIAEFEAYKEFYTWEINLYKAHQKARKLPKNKRSLSHLIQVVYEVFQEERGEKKKIWGEKTPVNTFFIDKIRKVFPKAKYIHIIRDPKDVSCSSVKAGIEKNHLEAAKNWAFVVRKVLKLKKKLPGNQFLQVRYEDLVQQPEKELRGIADFLNISYSSTMLEFYKKTEKLGDVNHLDHHRNIKNPISLKSIGKWKQELSPEKAKQISELTEQTYQKAIS